MHRRATILLTLILASAVGLAGCSHRELRKGQPEVVETSGAKPHWISSVVTSEKDGKLWVVGMGESERLSLATEKARASAVALLRRSVSEAVSVASATSAREAGMTAKESGEFTELTSAFVADALVMDGVRTEEQYWVKEAVAYDEVVRNRYRVSLLVSMPQASYQRAVTRAAEKLLAARTSSGDAKAHEAAQNLLQKVERSIGTP